MTQSNEQLRSGIKTSIFGRRVGLDNNDYLQGPLSPKYATQTLTSASTATAILPYGYTALSSSNGATFAMAAPVEGVDKRIFDSSTASGSVVVQLPTGVTFITTAGSSFNQATFSGIGQTADLFGQSTSAYAVLGLAGCAFSTF